MIIVIADDITGAAELAGIGLRYGLCVKLAADVQRNDQTDLLVIYSNTRSLQKEDAVSGMRQLAAKAAQLNPSWIYKKTDSVLRGYVIAELEAQMKTLGVDKALLVPANPGLGRTIENGLYYIHGKPLHETNFSADPEFPVKTSIVNDLLRAEGVSVSVIKPGEDLKTGVNVGETRTADDMRQWAAYQNESLLLAGGGFFFDVLLSGKYKRKENPGVGTRNYPMLFVIGTAFRKGDVGTRHSVSGEGKGKGDVGTRHSVSGEGKGKGDVGTRHSVSGKGKGKGDAGTRHSVSGKGKGKGDVGTRHTVSGERKDNSVSLMPAELFFDDIINDNSINEWRDEIVELIRKHNIAFIGIDGTKRGDAESLRGKMAKVVKAVVGKIRIHEIIIEGGSTAYSIVNELNWNEFTPIEEQAYGVVKMKVEDSDELFLTIKPGSYPWPTTWDFK